MDAKLLCRMKPSAAVCTEPGSGRKKVKQVYDMQHRGVINSVRRVEQNLADKIDRESRNQAARCSSLQEQLQAPAPGTA
jgi:hypothetical protein